MQIHTNYVRPTATSGVTPDAAKPSPQGVDPSTQFDATRSLDAALKDTPEVRREEVERATRLVETGNYPPPELINRLSRLLADEISKPPTV